jgi:hypothetical protein
LWEKTENNLPGRRLLVVGANGVADDAADGDAVLENVEHLARDGLDPTHHAALQQLGDVVEVGQRRVESAVEEDLPQRDDTHAELVNAALDLARAQVLKTLLDVRVGGAEVGQHRRLFVDALGRVLGKRHFHAPHNALDELEHVGGRTVAHARHARRHDGDGGGERHKQGGRENQQHDSKFGNVLGGAVTTTATPRDSKSKEKKFFFSRFFENFCRRSLTRATVASIYRTSSAKFAHV